MVVFPSEVIGQRSAIGVADGVITDEAKPQNAASLMRAARMFRNILSAPCSCLSGLFERAVPRSDIDVNVTHARRQKPRPG